MTGMGEAPFAAWRGQLRQRLLQWMFPPAVTWLACFSLAATLEGIRMNPFPEGGVPHRLFEDLAPALAALSVFAAAVGMQRRLLRRWPGFLRLPDSASAFATALRLVIHGMAAFVAVTVGAVAVLYLFYDPATDPQGQFHIWVWAGGFLYAMALAPAAAILTVWRAMGRRRGGGIAGGAAE